MENLLYGIHWGRVQVPTPYNYYTSKVKKWSTNILGEASALSLGSLLGVTGQALGNPGLTHHQNHRLISALLGPSTQGTQAWS